MTLPDTHPSQAPRKPVLLVILDGFGVNFCRQNNAIAIARTPNFDRLFSEYPHTHIGASGKAVGLPEGQMGNSEVGHMTLGSGMIVKQDLVNINDKIESGEFFANTALLSAMQRARDGGRPLHISGLVSDGGVHSHIQHLLALIDMCAQQSVIPHLHMITDGRDTPPRSALNYLEPVERKLAQAGGCIGSIMGRYYAMDRDKRWERTEIAWRAMVLGEARHSVTAAQAIQEAYDNGEDDEFIKPVRLTGAEVIEQGDDLVFFNFRKDRPRQLLAALDCSYFDGFDRDNAPRANVTCMMIYDHDMGMAYAFEHDTPKKTLAEILSKHELKHFHCAETEKFAHVTYFFNGGADKPMPGETRHLLPSPKVDTYDLKPDMSAADVTDSVIEAIDSQQYAFIVVNYANGDMVGHTAVRDAVIAAVETLDTEAGKLISHAVEAGYSIILTADHGNCEEMVDPYTGAPQTQHTTYPVPCLIIDKHKWKLSSNGGLANITPTVLHLMGIDIPKKMHPSLLLEPYN